MHLSFSSTWPCHIQSEMSINHPCKRVLSSFLRFSMIQWCPIKNTNPYLWTNSTNLLSHDWIADGLRWMVSIIISMLLLFAAAIMNRTNCWQVFSFSHKLLFSISIHLSIYPQHIQLQKFNSTVVAGFKIQYGAPDLSSAPLLWFSIWRENSKHSMK